MDPRSPGALEVSPTHRRLGPEGHSWSRAGAREKRLGERQQIPSPLSLLPLTPLAPNNQKSEDKGVFSVPNRAEAGDEWIWANGIEPAHIALMCWLYFKKYAFEEFPLWLCGLRTQHSDHEGAGSVSGFNQWVKGLAWPQAVA